MNKIKVVDEQESDSQLSYYEGEYDLEPPGYNYDPKSTDYTDNGNDDDRDAHAYSDDNSRTEFKNKNSSIITEQPEVSGYSSTSEAQK